MACTTCVASGPGHCVQIRWHGCKLQLLSGSFVDCSGLGPCCWPQLTSWPLSLPHNCMLCTLCALSCLGSKHLVHQHPTAQAGWCCMHAACSMPHLPVGHVSRLKGYGWVVWMAAAGHAHLCCTLGHMHKCAHTYLRHAIQSCMCNLQVSRFALKQARACTCTHPHLHTPSHTQHKQGHTLAPTHTHTYILACAHTLTRTLAHTTRTHADACRWGR